MKTEEICTEFDETFTELLKILSSFEQTNFNVKPAENKWSAGQVARHLVKGTSGFDEILGGETGEANRNPDEMIGKIKANFLDFDIKMDAPDFIVPEEQDYDRKDLLAALEEVKSEINKAAKTADLTKICLNFEFPVYGYLTGLETLAFMTYHTQRHIHQLKKISENINR